MIIEVRCMYHTIYLKVPDGVMDDFMKDPLASEEDFYMWIDSQPELIIVQGNDYARCFNEEHFVRYVDEVLLANSSQKSIRIRKPLFRKADVFFYI